MHPKYLVPAYYIYLRHINFVRDDNCSMMGVGGQSRRITTSTFELAENCTYTRVLNDQAEAVDDATAGMIIVILLFVLPSSLSFWPFVERMRNRGLLRNLDPRVPLCNTGTLRK